MDIFDRSENFKLVQRQTIKAARDLCYGEEVVKRLKAATTTDKLSDIMMEARKKKDWRD